MNWLDIAKNLSPNTKERVQCCGINRDAVISHNRDYYTYYCFRCDERIYERVGNRPLDQLFSNAPTKIESHELPEDFTTVIPLQHCLWLYKAALSRDVIVDAGIGWSDSLQRIVLPIRDPSGNVLYYQCRAVHQGQLPKYLNPPIDKASILYHSGIGSGLTRIVVCEDILSAIRVGKHTPACSILGTKTSDEQAMYLSNYKLVSYWLDPDKAGIRGSRSGIKKLSLTTDTEILTSNVDPKCLPDRCIRQVLGLPQLEKYIYHGCVTTKNTET